jgi:hypothetical protein
MPDASTLMRTGRVTPSHPAGVWAYAVAGSWPLPHCVGAGIPRPEPGRLRAGGGLAIRLLHVPGLPVAAGSANWLVVRVRSDGPAVGPVRLVRDSSARLYLVELMLATSAVGSAADQGGRHEVQAGTLARYPWLTTENTHLDPSRCQCGLIRKSGVLCSS